MREVCGSGVGGADGGSNSSGWVPGDRTCAVGDVLGELGIAAPDGCCSHQPLPLTP